MPIDELMGKIAEQIAFGCIAFAIIHGMVVGRRCRDGEAKGRDSKEQVDVVERRQTDGCES